MKFYHITLLKYNEIRIELYRSCIKHFSNLSFFAANAYHHLYPLIVPIRSDALSIRLNEGTESFGWWKFLVLGSGGQRKSIAMSHENFAFGHATH